MSFVLATTWSERGDQLQAVKDKCNAIITALNLPDADARAEGIIHVRQCCNTLAWVPIRLSQSAEIPADVPLMVRLLGLENQSALQNVLTDLNANAKASFLTVVQFALENSARRVAVELAGQGAPMGFKDIGKMLVTETGLSDPRNKLDLLLVLAYLRNTLHSNGIHYWPDVTITVAGEPFKFQKGKRSDCASWSHILYALLYSLSVFEEMYLSPRVKSVTSIPTV